MQTDDWILLVLLAGMAMSLRVIGLYGGKHMSKHTIVQSMLKALPGSVLIALVVPELVSRGAVGVLAMVATIGLMRMTRNMATSMVGGIVATGICRAAGL